MKKTILICFTCMLLLSCTTGHDSGRMVGNDRDAHGCIPSAGYSWCNKTRQCERPWELAKEEGFPNSQEAFDTFCGNNG